MKDDVRGRANNLRPPKFIKRYGLPLGGRKRITQILHVKTDEQTKRPTRRISCSKKSNKALLSAGYKMCDGDGFSNSHGKFVLVGYR